MGMNCNSHSIDPCNANSAEMLACIVKEVPRLVHVLHVPRLAGRLNLRKRRVMDGLLVPSTLF